MVLIKKEGKAEFVPDDGEIYQKLSQRQHVYLVCDTYAGSDQQTERDAWLFGESEQTTITLPQAVERTYLEILSNAGDAALRSRKDGFDPKIIEVVMDETTISIKNYGKPIPVEINKTNNIYNVELIFGHFLTSSNYTTQKRIGCGRNGIGAKLTNVFSLVFQVSTGDSIRKLEYFQEWRDNMAICSPPEITEYSGESYTEVCYILDFKRFGYGEYPEEAFNLFKRYAYDYSQTVRIPVSFNGEIFEPSNDVRDHGRFYFGNVPMIVHYEWPPETKVKRSKTGLETSKDPTILPTSLLILADTPNGGIVSFVNGMSCSEGVHIVESIKAISKPLLESLNKKKKLDERKTKLTWKDVKNQISILLVCHLEDPTFTGQSKEKLAKPTPKFNIPEKTLAPIMKWNLVHRLFAIIDAKIGKLLSSTDGKKKKNVSIKGSIDANEAGGSQSKKCILFVVEGKSAAGYAYMAQGIIDRGTDFIGILPLKGKPLNVMNANPIKINKNEEITKLKTMLGLRDFTDYHDQRNFNTLRYGGLTILADSDDDGKHITGLVLLIFHCFYPSLLELGYVSGLRTPIIRVGKFTFYTEAEYLLWKNKTPNCKKYGKADYYKGLGSSEEKEIEEDFKDPKYVKFLYQDEASRSLDLVFNNKRANDRKGWLQGWNKTLDDLNIGHLKQLSINDFIEKEFIMFCFTNIRRALCSFDGLKESQRKVLWGAHCIWKTKNEVKKVSGLAAYVTEHLDYHHGEQCLEKVIIGMAQDFVGSNNMRYLYPKGSFGSRWEGGADASAPRYICTKLEWWFPYIFKKEDMPLLEFLEEEGKKIEPKVMLPILPMHLINGVHGVGTAWSTFIPNHHPIDVLSWYKSRIKGEELPQIVPWYKGFKGEISIRVKKPEGESSSSEEISLSPRESESDEENPEINERFTQIEDNKLRISMISKGIFEVVDNKVIISELPLGVWVLKYKDWLEELLAAKKITSLINHCNLKERRIHFEIEGISPTYQKLRLQRSNGLTNMVLIDPDNKPIRYANIGEILESFYEWRLPYFEKRREHLMISLQEEIDELDALARFIQAVRDRKIDLNARDEEIEAKLIELKIPSHVRDRKIRILAKQGTESIYKKIEELEKKLEELKLKRGEDLWLEDLEAFEKVWKKPCKIKVRK